ncbi:MAG: 3',5'-cyclic-AMP phosphodiesterase [Wenzhouxiangellaceae bacterium]
MLRLVQISDLHLGNDWRRPYRGIDPRQRLLSLLPAMRAFAPQLLVATGDLVHDQGLAAYHWLAQQLRPVCNTILTAPGNHEQPRALNHEPFISAAATPYQTDGWRLLCLNSRWGDRPDGLLGDNELLRLQQLSGDQPTLVFLHHQPLAVGTPWIDRFPLLDGPRFVSIVEQLPMVKGVAFGHIHHAWQRSYRHRHSDLTLYGCPAASINTVPGVRHFTDDQLGPACRWFQLAPGGLIRSGLLRPAN